MDELDDGALAEINGIGDIPDLFLAAVREGAWKLLLGKEPGRVELFRFPGDRLEKTNLRDEHSDHVRRLTALIDAWKKTLPHKPSESCLSDRRGDRPVREQK